MTPKSPVLGTTRRVVGTAGGAAIAGLLLRTVLAMATEPIPSEPSIGTDGLELMEAIRLTLAQDPIIQLQDKAMVIAGGRVQQEAGRFDPRVASALIYELRPSVIPEGSVVGAPTSDGLLGLTREEATLRAAIEKPFRSGVTAGPGVEVIRADDNLAGTTAGNWAEVNFGLLVPLARGLGRRAVTAEERAAQIDYDVVRLTREHTVALRILNSTTAYWAYQAAARRFEILLRSEDRARELYQNTAALVDAEEVPFAELDQLRANLAAKTRTRIAATQDLFESRQRLGLAIGLAYGHIDRLPPASNAFPDHRNVPPPDLPEVQGYFQLAQERRADYRAARLAENSASALVDRARNDLKPRVDLNLKAGYGGFAQGGDLGRLASAFRENIEGVSALASLSFEWPISNKAARGQFTQRQSFHDQTVIRSEDLSRNIHSGVLVALQRLRNGLEELRQSSSATESYNRAVGNENKKRRLGLATFSEVLLVEDRLINASLDNVLAQLQYANAIVQLRFETGTLLVGDSTGQRITLTELTTIPSPSEHDPSSSPRGG